MKPVAPPAAPGAKRGGGRPSTDAVTCELFQRLVDWGVPQARAALLCKPRKPGRPKAKPESLGRPVVRRLLAARADRTPTVAPDGITPDVLKSLSDAAVRAMVVHGPNSRQYRAATAERPQIPLKLKDRVERTALKERAAAIEEHAARWRSKGLFDEDPPPLKRASNRVSSLSPKQEQEAARLLRLIIRTDADKVSETRRKKKKIIKKSKT